MGVLLTREEGQLLRRSRSLSSRCCRWLLRLIAILLAVLPDHRGEYLTITWMHIDIEYNKCPCRTILFLRHSSRVLGRRFHRR